MKPANANGNHAVSRRRSLLDLAPLELRCMTALWPLGEGTVREIREALAAKLPRAYTTIMTIMDRLARKGIVERRKSGRAYIYRPCLSVEEARAHALGQVVESFFGGSREIAAEYLHNGSHAETHAIEPRPQKAAAAAAGAVAGANRSGGALDSTAQPSIAPASANSRERVTKSPAEAAPPIDATLL